MSLCFFFWSRPLADSEKLPVRSHRAAEAPKSPAEDGDAENAVSQEPKKKSSKEKREKKKDKDRDRKVRLKWLFFFLVRIMFPSSRKPPSFSVELMQQLLKTSRSDLWSGLGKEKTTTTTTMRAVSRYDMMSQWLWFLILLWHTAEFILLGFFSFFFHRRAKKRRRRRNTNMKKRGRISSGFRQTSLLSNQKKPVRWLQCPPQPVLRYILRKGWSKAVSYLATEYISMI